MTKDRFLPGVPARLVEEMLNAGAGNEIASGKFDSPESSAALSANAFGFFLERPADMPPIPGLAADMTAPAVSIALEKQVNFPWRGGRHPVLDVLITAPSALVGVESKRFEPFRDKPKAEFSDAFWRPKWGGQMDGFQSVRDALAADPDMYAHLKADQLVKHALALRAQVNRQSHLGMTPVLVYLYAEPDILPKSGKPVPESARAAHRREIADFARRIADDEVRFAPCSYGALLAAWGESESPGVRAHAAAVARRYRPTPRA